MALTKRTPCVGICSTTFGDLVCRGCKRFAHEVVQWNGYEPDQQAQIWARLNGLLDEVVRSRVEISDTQLFGLVQQQAKLNSLEGSQLIYRMLGFLGAKSMPLSGAGLTHLMSGPTDALSLMQSIDKEMYQRSVAHYERNFKVPL